MQGYFQKKMRHSICIFLFVGFDGDVPRRRVLVLGDTTKHSYKELKLLFWQNLLDLQDNIGFLFSPRPT